MLQEPMEVEDGESCTVCMGRPRTFRNQPCGHATLCELCTTKIMNTRAQTLQCPQCRGAVTSLEFLPAIIQGSARQAVMPAYEPFLPDELRQAATLLEQGNLRQALEKAASVVDALKQIILFSSQYISSAVN